MSILAQQFRAQVSKSKDPRMKNETEYDVAYPTGFLSFDYMNGTVIHVKSEDKNFKYNSIGIVDGSMTTVIGRSGCGKTTWLMQTASELIKPFKTSCIFHDDIEGGITQSRKEQLLGLHGEELSERYISRNSGITAENFFERIKMIHDIKIKDRATYEYDTGLFSDTGERIYKLEPTVYILDSLAMLMPEKNTSEDELSGQMAATAAAKTNSAIFKRIIPMLKSANIMLFIVNHITQTIDINMFQKTQAQLSYLKQGEALGGGRAAVYLANLLIRFTDHSKLKSTEGYGIDGTLVDLSLLKSRTSNAGNSITLVFNYACGFDRELSLLHLLKENKKINGAGAYLYIGDRSDIKFSQKKFKEKLRENEEFRKIFMEACFEVLQTLINDPGEIEEDDGFDITSIMLNNASIQLAA